MRRKLLFSFFISTFARSLFNSGLFTYLVFLRLPIGHFFSFGVCFLLLVFVFVEFSYRSFRTFVVYLSSFPISCAALYSWQDVNEKSAEGFAHQATPFYSINCIGFTKTKQKNHPRLLFEDTVIRRSRVERPSRRLTWPNSPTLSRDLSLSLSACPSPSLVKASVRLTSTKTRGEQSAVQALLKRRWDVRGKCGRPVFARLRVH